MLTAFNEVPISLVYVCRYVTSIYFIKLSYHGVRMTESHIIFLCLFKKLRLERICTYAGDSSFTIVPTTVIP
jgi:hypothetical protein